MMVRVAGPAPGPIRPALGPELTAGPQLTIFCEKGCKSDAELIRVVLFFL